MNFKKNNIESLGEDFGRFDDKKNSILNSDTQLTNKSVTSQNLNQTFPESANNTDYINRLLYFINSLFNNPEYSDLKIHYGDSQFLYAHKFVLKLRNKDWKIFDLNSVSELTLTDFDEHVVNEIFRWVYTGDIDLTHKSEEFNFLIIEQAGLLNLNELVETCVFQLQKLVRMENCVYFYQKARQLSLISLAESSSKLITLHWDDLEITNFVRVSSDFLFDLFMEKAPFPLNKAVRIRSKILVEKILGTLEILHSTINLQDNFGQAPLDIALTEGQFDIAKCLIEHNANVNKQNAARESLLHQHIKLKNFEAAKFLIEHKASLQPVPDQDGLLHLCANIEINDNIEEKKMIELAKLLIDNNININYENGNRETALHRSILNKKKELFDLLLVQKNLNLNSRTNQGESPIYLGLKQIRSTDYFAKQLIENQVLLDEEDSKGNNLLMRAINDRNESAAMFLVENGYNIHHVNILGETPLHSAALFGLDTLVVKLLTQNADCNEVTTQSASYDDEENPLDYMQTPLHYAIHGGHQSTVRLLLSFHESSTRKGVLTSAIMKPNLNIQNSNHQTALSMSIDLNLLEISEMLINAGADINIRYQNGLTLLHRAIQNGSEELADFIIEHGADFSLKDLNGETYLQYAVRANLPILTKKLCGFGLDPNKQNAVNGDPLLWEALVLLPNFDVAQILVRYGCDVNGWHLSTEYGFYQTMLHRALDENKIEAALFLIENRCNVNCTRKKGPNGEGAEDCFDYPIHVASLWSFLPVVQALLDNDACCNSSNGEGKSALHLAILNQDIEMIETLLTCPSIDLYKTDNFGTSPFSLAVKLRNKKIAKMLCTKDEHVAEQCDGKGRNFLHLALKKNEYESVLFLLDLNVNVNSYVHDSERKLPIHLAAESGSEIILRTLNLAGANVNEQSALNQTALHLASELNNPAIVNILLDFNINPYIKDINGNNSFHLAAYQSNAGTCEVFIQHKMKFEFYCNQNYRGFNALHCLATSSNQNDSDIIFNSLIRLFPNYPLNISDNDGNTPLLLAFMKGNSKLCRAFVREGAVLGQRNVHKMSIFNHKMPTRQLLTSLLDSLTKPPEWKDGPECLECGFGFSLTNRRHHCRHCSRELCGKCSTKEIIIMKYVSDTKRSPPPLRVCDICYEVLSTGVFD